VLKKGRIAVGIFLFFLCAGLLFLLITEIDGRLYGGGVKVVDVPQESRAGFYAYYILVSLMVPAVPLVLEVFT